MSQWDSETAEWYAENYGEYATNRLGVRSVTLAADATVVDIGCGTGCALRHASRQVTRGRLIGLDPVPRMVEIARQHTASHPAAERIEFHQGSAEDLPVADACADFVLAFDSFDHWQDQQQGLMEVRRVLRSGGRFVVVKDGGLPDGTAARGAFVEALGAARFEVIEESTIEQDDVKFALWLCCSGPRTGIGI